MIEKGRLTLAIVGEVVDLGKQIIVRLVQHRETRCVCESKAVAASGLWPRTSGVRGFEFSDIGDVSKFLIFEIFREFIHSFVRP